MKIEMTIPDGYHAVTRYFTVSNADQLFGSLVEVFTGSVVVTNRYPYVRIQHARARIADPVILLNESNEHYSANVSQMHVYVKDADTVFSKAISVGPILLWSPMTVHMEIAWQGSKICVGTFGG